MRMRLCLVLLMITGIVRGQADDHEQLKGTFQIQMVDTRALPEFHISLYDTIQAKRQDHYNVIHVVDEHMQIEIFSRDVLEDPNFEAPERIAYIRREE